LYVNGALVAADLIFQTSGAPLFSVTGFPTAPVRFDDLLIGRENPLFVDADHDGMDDAWEIAHGLDPTIDDRRGDLDGDGIFNIREYLLGLDPNNPDTDGDGLPDAWEINHGFDPRHREPDAVLNEDADGDGQTLVQEVQAGTDPNNPDTDGDGILDGHSP
jgi:hypothetical protein